MNSSTDMEMKIIELIKERVIENVKLKAKPDPRVTPIAIIRGLCHIVEMSGQPLLLKSLVETVINNWILFIHDRIVKQG